MYEFPARFTKGPFQVHFRGTANTNGKQGVPVVF